MWRTENVLDRKPVMMILGITLYSSGRLVPSGIYSVDNPSLGNASHNYPSGYHEWSKLRITFTQTSYSN